MWAGRRRGHQDQILTLPNWGICDDKRTALSF
jgi:hypothetical protein